MYEDVVSFYVVRYAHRKIDWRRLSMVCGAGIQYAATQ